MKLQDLLDIKPNEEEENQLENQDKKQNSESGDVTIIVDNNLHQLQESKQIRTMLSDSIQIKQMANTERILERQEKTKKIDIMKLIPGKERKI